MTNSMVQAESIGGRARGEISGQGRWPAPAGAAASRFTSWLERLARWAERQPQHHRLGSYLRREPPAPQA